MPITGHCHFRGQHRPGMPAKVLVLAQLPLVARPRPVLVPRMARRPPAYREQLRRSVRVAALLVRPHRRPASRGDRKSVVYGKSVDLGGRRIIKKKKNWTFRYYAEVLQSRQALYV